MRRTDCTPASRPAPRSAPSAATGIATTIAINPQPPRSGTDPEHRPRHERGRERHRDQDDQGALASSGARTGPERSPPAGDRSEGSWAEHVRLPCDGQRPTVGRRDPELELPRATSAAASSRFRPRTARTRSCSSSTTDPPTAPSRSSSARGSRMAPPQNLGFARAVNLGVSRTRSPLAMVLNADTRLEPGCLERLAAALEADSTLGGVQPLILQLEPGTPPPAGRSRHRRVQRRPGADRGRARPRGGSGAAAERRVRRSARDLRRLRRRLHAAARAVGCARRLRRAVLRVLRGRRPERARPGRRLAIRPRARRGGLASGERGVGPGLRASRGRQRPPGRPQSARHPDQVHARPLDSRGSRWSRPGRSAEPRGNGACSRRSPASSRPFAGCRR